jgi:hypothetical protein
MSDVPAGAVEVHPWCDGGRYFVGQSAKVDIDAGTGRQAHIVIDGTQRADGVVIRRVCLDGLPLSPADARELASTLYQLASHAQHMGELDRPKRR